MGLVAETGKDMTAYLDLGDLNPYAVRASLRTGRRSDLPARSPSITRSRLPVSRGSSELDSRSLWLTNEPNALHVPGRRVDQGPHQGSLHLQSGTCSLQFGGSSRARCLLLVASLITIAVSQKDLTDGLADAGTAGLAMLPGQQIQPHADRNRGSREAHSSTLLGVGLPEEGGWLPTEADLWIQQQVHAIKRMRRPSRDTSSSSQGCRDTGTKQGLPNRRPAIADNAEYELLQPEQCQNNPPNSIVLRNKTRHHGECSCQQ